MKNFLNGWGFLTGIPLSALIFLLSMLISETSKRKCHCDGEEWIGIGMTAVVGVEFLLVSSVLYSGTYLLSGLLILNKQRQIFLFYVTSILYWGFNLVFIFMIGTLEGKCLRFIKDHSEHPFFFCCFVWWILSVCFAIIISRFTSERFLQKTNRIFSKIGRCFCWITVLFFLCILLVWILGLFVQPR